MKYLFLTLSLIFSMFKIQAQNHNNILQEIKLKLQKQNISFDKSVKLEQLSKAYLEHPDRWNAAFNYIAETDLQKDSIGVRELLGKACFATVSQYPTKDPAIGKIESHKTYTDIQMVIDGEEHIGLVDAKDVEVVYPYNEKRDIAFYSSNKVLNYVARAKKIFIFFPGDIHQPGLRIKKTEEVKKLVIKVMN